MSLQAVPLFPGFQSQYWKDIFPLQLFRGSEAIESLKNNCDDSKRWFSEIESGKISVEILGKTLPLDVVASPVLSALTKSHVPDANEKEQWRKNWLYLSYYFRLCKLKRNNVKRVSRQAYAKWNRLDKDNKETMLKIARILKCTILQAQIAYGQVDRLSLARKVSRICFLCPCTASQVHDSLLFQNDEIFRLLRTVYVNYFGISKIVYCVMHAGQRMTENMLCRLVNETAEGKKWLVSNNMSICL